MVTAGDPSVRTVRPWIDTRPPSVRDRTQPAAGRRPARAPGPGRRRAGRAARWRTGARPTVAAPADRPVGQQDQSVEGDELADGQLPAHHGQAADPQHEGEGEERDERDGGVVAHERHVGAVDPAGQRVELPAQEAPQGALGAPGLHRLDAADGVDLAGVVRCRTPPPARRAAGRSRRREYTMAAT